MTIRHFFGKRATKVSAAFAAAALVMTACSGGGAEQSGAAQSEAKADAPAAAPAANGEKIKIGVSMPTQTAERWIADGEAVKKGLEEAGYEVDLQFANNDIPTQTQQIDQMITTGSKVLIIAAIDGSSLSAQLDNAGAQGIPVLAYDRLIRESEHVTHYVSFDNYKVGVAQANALLFGMGVTDKDGKKKDDAKKGLNIEVFAGALDDNNAHFFFNGAMDTLKPFVEDGTVVIKSGQNTIEKVAIERWEQNNAQKRMEDLLTANYGGGTEALAGVLSPYDGISRGIIIALQSAGYGQGDKAFPVVTGQDAEIASVKLIDDGVQHSTIFKNTNTLAKQAVKAVDQMAKGEKPEVNDEKTYDNGKKVVPSYLLEVETVYKDDIKKALIDSGYYTEEQVKAGVK